MTVHKCSKEIGKNLGRKHCVFTKANLSENNTTHFEKEGRLLNLEYI
jgi:hypothetical protein